MLGMTMPVGVMTVLVVYTIAHQTAEPGGTLVQPHCLCRDAGGALAAPQRRALHRRRDRVLHGDRQSYCELEIGKLLEGLLPEALANSSLLRIVAEISGISA